MFLLTVFHRHVFAAVLGKARHLRSSGGRQIERVGRDQIERSPLPHFPRAPGTRATSGRLWLGEFPKQTLGQTEIVIFVLTGVVNYRADVQALHPRVSRAVVEQTEIGAAPG